MEHIGILFYNDVSVAAVLLLKIYFGGTRRKIIVGGGGTNSDFLHPDGQNIDWHQAYKSHMQCLAFTESEVSRIF